MQAIKTFYLSRLTLHIFLTWVTMISALTLGYSYWLHTQYKPNHPPTSKVLRNGVREVRLSLNHYDHYVSSGSINGHAVNFLLDTGSTHVAMPAALARKIGLSFGSPMLTETANGNIEVYKTTIETLEIGHIRLHHVSASINPFMQQQDDILLGMSVLKQLDFQQKNRQLVLTQLNNS